MEARPNSILEMRDIVKTYPGVRALDGVSVSIQRGEIHAVCGENGAGKSTLMGVISGISPLGSYEGEMTFNGTRANFRSIRDSEAQGIVIIHQELALFPYLSIAENIFLGNEIRNALGLIDWDATNHQASKLLERVGLDENPTTEVGRLGVGKQQLVEIAKAIAKRVDLLILDEPTAALNDVDSMQMLDLISDLRDNGVTCIIISHKLDEIMRIADNVTILRDGKTVETIARKDVTEDRIVRGMVGRIIEHRFPERNATIGDTIFSIENWFVNAPDDHRRVVVNNASINVRRGEVVGLAGLIGAGRTELAMSVFGRSYGVNGRGVVKVDGVEVKTRTVQEAIQNGIAYSTEDRKALGLNLIDTIARNISVGAFGKVSTLGFMSERREAAYASDFRTSMSIRTTSIDAITGNLSGGNQQKVVLSKSLFSDPNVLILDEPTRGIDIGAKSEIYAHINSLAEAGKGILVISSELPELLGICDRIYAMSSGNITGEVVAQTASPESLLRLMTIDTPSGSDHLEGEDK